MTSDAKRELARTIRALRKRLLEDLGEALASVYKLSIAAKQAQLDEAERLKRARLETWIDEQVRALPAKARPGAAQRLLDDVIKDAAATLLLRLVYLRLLEASGVIEPATGLPRLKVVSGGWNSPGYKDFRSVAPELVRGDETEGYAALLELIYAELAIDLPGLYGPVRMTALVPVPPATLRAVIDALDDEALASVWTDDTTLGWIYQYWNDPEREALDAKLAASKKLENHEIASKTQMFTERYMVEWLLHNSLGQMWLAICQQHGWTARVKRADHGQPSVLDQLETRRIAWRAQREAGDVALDALMPIEPGLEDRWKYWVPQPMPDDAVTSAPASVRDLKLLDPACGSGHFLVIAFELLFHLYREEAWLRGLTSSPDAEGPGEWSDAKIVEAILEHNLFGIDIDPKAVQIAAAALMLKARQLCPAAEPPTINLVAPALSLARLGDDDPARRELYAAVQAETGIPPELTARIVDGLAGADHLGTLLKVDAAIETAIAEYGAELSAEPAQVSFSGFGPVRRKRVTAEHAKATLLDRLEAFLSHHTRGADLGLRLRGEQLAAGVRFVRMVREGQYDLVVGNPPYQGTSKMADKAYVEEHYERGKADLYAAFLERGLQLAKHGGMSALLTMRNWMFIKQFSALRAWLLHANDLRILGDVDRGAFDEVPNEVLAAVMSVLRNARPRDGIASVAVQPTALDDRSYDRARTNRKRGALLAQVGRFLFDVDTLSVIEDVPLIYWWSAERLASYRKTPKLGDIAPVRQGTSTANNARFVRKAWEVRGSKLLLSRRFDRRSEGGIDWVPYVMGAAGRSWIEGLEDVVLWRSHGLAMKTSATAALRNADFHFLQGVAYSTIGQVFSARAHRYASIFSDKGASVFPEDVGAVVALMNAATTKELLSDLNPSLSFQVGDVERIALYPVLGADYVMSVLEDSFREHESHREPSVEFCSPGPSSWNQTQRWAQAAVDRREKTQLETYIPNSDAEVPATHLSFAIGIALGRFGADREGTLGQAPVTALRHGILFLSDATNDDSLAHPAAAPILDAWATRGAQIDDKRTLKDYLQDRFFPDVHRPMYENRPIYFPLSSAKKSFVAYVSIHRWTSTTLDDLLAEHLEPAKKQLEGALTDLRAARDGADKKASKAAEKRFGEVTKWLAELTEFIAAVEQCANKGPLPPDTKTRPRDADARYIPDLDDGVMINSAALWPLLEPQWKDPKKWWRELANAEGKKDYDWSHLAARYFPDRVDAKCKDDPSLAVAHGCFWKYHAAKAYQWELRLQDEIRPDFTLDEVGSDAARAAFEAEHPDLVEELVTKEHARRRKKQAKAEGADQDGDDAPQAELALDEEADDEADE